MSVTIVQAGTQHNVVPDACTFTIDVRSNECYTNQMLLEEISAHLQSDVKAFYAPQLVVNLPAHPLVLRAEASAADPSARQRSATRHFMPWPLTEDGTWRVVALTHRRRIHRFAGN